ncbi:MAG TPA: cytochrome c-type biogenesis CcmF C-terminal domain-containing protein, partial [Cellvibrionaceae bacterium]|nr:cytochrome c-type biogenesis CcmF C-terminal domain-containing protein [Cellvibrionaceae bacterium]
ALRVHYKPFVRWIWLGALLMALGGTLAIIDKRYRLKVATTQGNTIEPKAAIAIAAQARESV